MKKQFLIFATAITTVAFISCSKEKIETQQRGNLEEIATAKKPGGGNSFTPVSNKGLLGRFEFDNNLKDGTGQLAEGVSTVNRVLYTADRKGIPNKAILFNEAYGVDIFDVPWSSETSVSFWVKHDVAYPLSWRLMLLNQKGFVFQQTQTTVACNYWNGIGVNPVYAGSFNNKWHHLAATRDNNEMKFYIDGVLIGTEPTPAGAGPYLPLEYYQLGYGTGYFWKGSMDDLRFYARVLSADEVNTLANF